MSSSFINSIKKANTLERLLDIVRKIVFNYSGHKKNGIKIRLKDLGYNRFFFTEAYYNFYNNSITINSAPLETLKKKDEEFLNFYLFHLILHEYIHSLGVLDEYKTREITYIISKHYFGEEHPITKLAKASLVQLEILLARTERIRQFEKAVFTEMGTFIKRVISDLKKILGYRED